MKTNCERAIEHRQKAADLWPQAVAVRHQALDHPPGTPARDERLGRFFSILEQVRGEVEWVFTPDHEHHFLHLARMILGGLDALRDGVAEAPDDDGAIRNLIEREGGRVAGGLQRLRPDWTPPQGTG